MDEEVRSLSPSISSEEKERLTELTIVAIRRAIPINRPSLESPSVESSETIVGGVAGIVLIPLSIPQTSWSALPFPLHNEKDGRSETHLERRCRLSPDPSSLERERKGSSRKGQGDDPAPPSLLFCFPSLWSWSDPRRDGCGRGTWRRGEEEAESRGVGWMGMDATKEEGRGWEGQEREGGIELSGVRWQRCLACPRHPVLVDHYFSSLRTHS